MVTVELIDGSGSPQPLEVVLDTGFTGYLTLPSESIEQLDLPFVGQRTFELANGELFRFDAYLAAMSWHGSLRDALVLQSDSTPLLGMTLLWGSRVTPLPVERARSTSWRLLNNGPGLTCSQGWTQHAPSNGA